MSENKSWYNQDYFWETVETILFDQQRLSSTSTEVEKIINLLEIRAGMQVLDLCCGKGLIMKVFSKYHACQYVSGYMYHQQSER